MPRIMLVDDEPNVLSSLRRAINALPTDSFSEAFEVETFVDPKLALQRASRCTFDLVVSDYRMPEMSGVEFLVQLIQIQPQIAKIMLSGYADLKALMSAINEVNVYRFVAKPWGDYELGSSIVRAIQHQQMLQENQRMADMVRLQQGRITEQELALRRWEELCPGLTKVQRGEDGSVDLEWDDAPGSSASALFGR